MSEVRVSEVDQLLLRLETVLDQERDALRLLDSRTVERLADEKHELDEEIRGLKAPAAGAPSEALLRQVQRKAQDNQVLLVHARNCVRSALEAMTGRHQGSYDSNRPPPSRAVRFDLKG